MAPVLGRVPIAEDEDRVAVLSHGLWMSWFGGDTAVIGRSYYIGGQQRTVIGVMGPDFRFPRDGVTLWITARHPSGRHRARAGSGWRWSGGCGPA